MEKHAKGPAAQVNGAGSPRDSCGGGFTCIWRQWSTWAIVGVLGALIAWLESGAPSAKQSHARVEHWSTLDMEQAVAKREPFVIEGGPVRSWKVSNWTQASLVHSIDTLYGVRQNDQRVFEYFNTDKPMATLRGAQNSAKFKVIDMSSKSFFDKIHEVGSPFHYFSANVESFPSLRDDIPHRDLERFKVTPDGLTINLWLGAKGVIAETHVDTSHNFYFQIEGRKRFVLLPPTAVHKIGFHPFLHPAYRRARIALRQSGTLELKKELLQSLQAVVIDLKPGQILYLPPYWFHNVEALDPSISINVWTDSEEYQTTEEIFTSPVPFEEDWEEERMSVALSTYLDMLLHEFPSIRSATLKSLLVRFKGLAGVQDPPVKLSQAYCDKDKALETQMRRGIDVIGPLFAKLPPGVQEIYLGNFVEVLTHYVLGVERVFPYIVQCLTDGEHGNML